MKGDLGGIYLWKRFNFFLKFKKTSITDGIKARDKKKSWGVATMRPWQAMGIMKGSELQ